MKNTSLLLELAMPFVSALPGGESTITGEVIQVWPLFVERQYQMALPPVPCCAKARISPAAALYETAHPPSGKMLLRALPNVVQLDHWEPAVGSVMRWYWNDC